MIRRLRIEYRFDFGKIRADTIPAARFERKDPLRVGMQQILPVHIGEVGLRALRQTLCGGFQQSRYVHVDHHHAEDFS